MDSSVTASYWDHLGEPIHYHDLHQSRAELLGASLRGTITAQFTQSARKCNRHCEPPCQFLHGHGQVGGRSVQRTLPDGLGSRRNGRGTVGYISSTMTRHRSFRDSTPLETSPHGIASSAQPPERVAPTCRGPLPTGTWAGRAAASFSDSRRATDLSEHSIVRNARCERSRFRRRTRLCSRHSVRDAPIDKSVFRSNGGLIDSATRLDRLWESASRDLDHTTAGTEAIAQREAAGMLAMSRWAVRSALVRTETRGMPYSHRLSRHRRGPNPIACSVAA